MGVVDLGVKSDKKRPWQKSKKLVKNLNKKVHRRKNLEKRP